MSFIEDDFLQDDTDYDESCDMEEEDEQEEDEEEDEITSYYCKFCECRIDFAEESSCEHALFHLATADMEIIYLDDGLRELIKKLMDDDLAAGKMDCEEHEEKLFSLGIQKNNQGAYEYRDLTETHAVLHFNAWDTINLVQYYEKEIVQVISSFEFAFHGVSGGTMGYLGNFLGLASEDDVSELNSQYP